MNEWIRVLLFMASCVFTDNAVLMRASGSESFLGASGNLKPAARVGMATSGIMLVSSVLNWAAYRGVLVPLGADYLAVPVYALIISLVVWALGMLTPERARMRAALPFLYVNSIVLGAALMNMGEGYNLLYSALNGLFGGAGYFVAIVLLAAIRERLDKSDIPSGMKGLPIGIVMAGLMSMAFMGLTNMVR